MEGIRPLRKWEDGVHVGSGEATKCRRWLTVRPVTAGTVIRGSCPQRRVLPPISLLSVQLCSSSCSDSLPPLAPGESCQLGVIRKRGQREGSGFRGLQGRGRFCGDGKIRDAEEVAVQALAVCVCV